MNDKKREIVPVPEAMERARQIIEVATINLGEPPARAPVASAGIGILAGKSQHVAHYLNRLVEHARRQAEEYERIVGQIVWDMHLSSKQVQKLRADIESLAATTGTPKNVMAWEIRRVSQDGTPRWMAPHIEASKVISGIARVFVQEMRAGVSSEDSKEAAPPANREARRAEKHRRGKRPPGIYDRMHK